VKINPCIKIAGMENLKMKKQQTSYLKLNRIILTAVFVIIAIAVVLILVFSPAPLYVIAIVIPVLVCIYFLIFFYMAAHFRHYGYAMNDYGLYINHGVFWRRKIVVPRNRVQHTDIVQGPLDRKYDLAELVIHTAGTRNASVKLVGILHHQAEELRESLSFEEAQDAV